MGLYRFYPSRSTVLCPNRKTMRLTCERARVLRIWCSIFGHDWHNDISVIRAQFTRVECSRCVSSAIQYTHRRRHTDTDTRTAIHMRMRARVRLSVFVPCWQYLFVCFSSLPFYFSLVVFSALCYEPFSPAISLHSWWHCGSSVRTKYIDILLWWLHHD